MSSLFSASSISVLPISFFAYFSKLYSANRDKDVRRTLTHSALLDFLCCDPENRECLHQYLNDYIHHFCCRPYFCVYLETSKEQLNPLEDVDKSVFACSNIFSRLRDLCVTMAHAKVLTIHTERRTPIPAKMTLAGEKSCHTNMREHISEKRMSCIPS